MRALLAAVLAPLLACTAGPGQSPRVVAPPPPAELDPRNRDSAALRLELVVQDAQRSVNFYAGVLGFELVDDLATHPVVSAGSVELGLTPVDQLSRDHWFQPDVLTVRRGLGAEIVIDVADVENYFAAVSAAGYQVQLPLAEREPGLVDFRLVDPDGYYLRLVGR